MFPQHVNRTFIWYMLSEHSIHKFNQNSVLISILKTQFASHFFVFQVKSDKKIVSRRGTRIQTIFVLFIFLFGIFIQYQSDMVNCSFQLLTIRIHCQSLDSLIKQHLHWTLVSCFNHRRIFVLVVVNKR